MELFTSLPWTLSPSPRRLALLFTSSAIYCYILWLYNLDIILLLIFSPLLYAFLFSLPLYKPYTPSPQTGRVAKTIKGIHLPLASLKVLYGNSFDKERKAPSATSSYIVSNLILNPPSLPPACPAPVPRVLNSLDLNSEKRAEQSARLIGNRPCSNVFSEIIKQRKNVVDDRAPLYRQSGTIPVAVNALADTPLDPLDSALRNFFVGVDAGKHDSSQRKLSETLLVKSLFPPSAFNSIPKQYASPKEWKSQMPVGVASKEHFSDVNNRIKWKSATEAVDEINLKLREIKEEYSASPISMFLFGDRKYLNFQKMFENFLYEYQLGEPSFPWKNIKEINRTLSKQGKRVVDPSLWKSQRSVFLDNLKQAQQQMQSSFYPPPSLIQTFEEVPSIPSVDYKTRFAGNIYEPREIKPMEALARQLSKESPLVFRKIYDMPPSRLDKKRDQQIKSISSYAHDVEKGMYHQNINDPFKTPIISIRGGNLADDMQQMTLGDGEQFGLVEWPAKEFIPEDTLGLYKKLGGDVNWMRHRLKTFLHAIRINSFSKIYEIPELDKALDSLFGQLGYKYIVEDPSRLERLKTPATINLFDRALPAELNLVQFIQLKRLFEYRQRLETYLLPPAHHGGFDQRDYVLKRIRIWISKGIERSYKWNYCEDPLLPTDSHIMVCLISNTLRDILGEEILNHVELGGILSGKSKYSYGKYFLIRNVNLHNRSARAPLHFELQDDQMRIYPLPKGNSNVFQAFSILLFFLLRFGNERSLRSKLPSGFD